MASPSTQVGLQKPDLQIKSGSDDNENEESFPARKKGVLITCPTKIRIDSNTPNSIVSGGVFKIR